MPITGHWLLLTVDEQPRGYQYYRFEERGGGNTIVRARRRLWTPALAAAPSQDLSQAFHFRERELIYFSCRDAASDYQIELHLDSDELGLRMSGIVRENGAMRAVNYPKGSYALPTEALIAYAHWTPLKIGGRQIMLEWDIQTGEIAPASVEVVGQSNNAGEPPLYELLFRRDGRPLLRLWLDGERRLWRLSAAAFQGERRERSAIARLLPGALGE